MWTIKSNGDYDTLSQIHSQYITSPGAHSGPAFPGWHREFIKRRVDPTVALPYWDSTLDSTLPNPSHSCLWGNELMGSQDSTGTGSRVFTRDIGKTGNLLNEADIQALLSTPDFTQLLAFTAPQAVVKDFQTIGEKLSFTHSGDMLITTTATNDPLFFNHHSMIDLIWELWRTQQQSRTERETEYPDDNAACSSSAHFVNNTMAPFFPMVNLDGLSNKYTDNLYQYSPRPTCSSSNVNGCGSKYLFCDVSHGPARCASKINLGGNCSGYTNNEDACYLGQCMNSICTAIPTCFNEQQCCSPWSSRGECSRNPTYMNVWCKASCGICTPSTYDLTQGERNVLHITFNRYNF
ncbi:unnamed protein product [Nippostrongylus brasiliensis]|uniref:ShKT domain-containing protein n=1 Tax=Nippostrongylus brasiliensis TaxID=27835 RepID=A0A158QWN1_NIPBR|nr:unnamed protein product [Nippostrongylus brasiliensis]